MDSLKRGFGQFLELYRSMTPSQRGTLIVVPLLTVVGLGFVMFTGSSGSYQALSWGKVFTTEELINAEQTLIQAGLTEFQREGQRILVPSAEVDRYNAALITDGTLPSESVSEWERQFEKSTSFTSQSQLETLKEIALRKEMRRVLRAVPSIEDATVLWARTEDRSPFRRNHQVKATVTVRPKSGRELSRTLVESLRAAVASMIPDLAPQDVTVFDQSTGVSHTAAKDGDPFDSRLLTKVRQFEQAEHEKIVHALSIQDILVTVSVDLDNLQRHVERSRKIEKAIEIQRSKTSKDLQSARPTSGGEAGVNSNAPRNLNVKTAAAASESVNETTEDSTSVPSSVTDTEKVYTAAMPQAVRVTVSIPDDHYRAIALKQGLKEGETDTEKAAFAQAVQAIEQKELSSVEKTVRTLLPKDSPQEALNVRTYVRLSDTGDMPQVSLFDTVGGAASRWGSAVGLGLFALWALWMLNKSLGSLPKSEVSAPPIPDVSTALKKEERSEEAEGELTPKIPSKRDELQMTVRDNPELAAAVLSRWIRAAAK